MQLSEFRTHRYLMPGAIVGLLALTCSLALLKRAPAAEPDELLQREKLQSQQVSVLRLTPTKRTELADALAQLSMIHFEIVSKPQPNDVSALLDNADREAREAVRLVDSKDRSSRAYYNSRLALSFALNYRGQNGPSVIAPLLHGNWSDLEKATLYDQLVGDEASIKALELRLKAAGPDSLEVADSLNVVSTSNNILSKGLQKQLQLSGYETSDNFGSDFMSRYQSCRRRAAQIQEKILGPSDLSVARTIQGLGENESLRAIEIYKKHFGPDSDEVQWAYYNLSQTVQNSEKKREYELRAAQAGALSSAGNNFLKRAYVYLNSYEPLNDSVSSKNIVSSAFQAFGIDVPKMKKPVILSGAIGHVLDTKKLGVSSFDRLTVDSSAGLTSHLSFDQLYLRGYKNNQSVLVMRLPTWGSDWTVEVVGPGRIALKQNELFEFGSQEVDYQWTGKSFSLIGGKVGKKEAAHVASAIDDALTGVGYYGIRGHHTANREIVKSALHRADKTASELYKNGDALSAAERLKAMFELTTDLVEEASTGVSIDSVDPNKPDDLNRWKKAWSYKGKLFSIGLTDKDWQPWLDAYAKYKYESQAKI